MPYTETQREALKKAIASGTKRVTYEGKTVEYRDLAEMKQALAEIEDELNSAAGIPVTRQVRVYSQKGL